MRHLYFNKLEPWLRDIRGRNKIGSESGISHDKSNKGGSEAAKNTAGVWRSRTPCQLSPEVILHKSDAEIPQTNHYQTSEDTDLSDLVE